VDDLGIIRQPLAVRVRVVGAGPLAARPEKVARLGRVHDAAALEKWRKKKRKRGKEPGIGRQKERRLGGPRAALLGRLQEGKKRSLAIGGGKRESVEKRKGFSKSSALWEV
jgi:hypothetical protein